MNSERESNAVEYIRNYRKRWSKTLLENDFNISWLFTTTWSHAKSRERNARKHHNPYMCTWLIGTINFHPRYDRRRLISCASEIIGESSFPQVYAGINKNLNKRDKWRWLRLTMKECINQKGSLLIFKNNEMRKELLIFKLIRNNIKLYAWLLEINLSREMKLQRYRYSLQLQGGGAGRGWGEQEVARNFPKTLKNKIRRRASERIKGDDCAALRITKDRGRRCKGDSREACIMDRYCCVSMRPLSSYKSVGGFSARTAFFHLPRAKKTRDCPVARSSRWITLNPIATVSSRSWRNDQT